MGSPGKYDKKKYMSLREAAPLLGVSFKYLTDLVRKMPEWVEMDGEYRRIVRNHPALLEEAKRRKEEKEAKQKIQNDIAQIDADPSIQDLRRKSTMAELETNIYRAQLDRYKVEKAKLELERRAKNVAEVSDMEYLFTSYIERMHVEKLNIGNRLLKKIELEIQEGVHNKTPVKNIAKKIESLIIKEEEAILRDVVRAQEQGFKEWKDNS